MSLVAMCPPNYCNSKWHFSTDNLKGSPATASPVTEYGSVTAKIPEKSFPTGGSDSPLRSKLLISRAKLHHYPTQRPETFSNIPQNDIIRRNFGSRNVFFLLLSVAIHNVFEGIKKFTTVIIQCVCKTWRIQRLLFILF